MCLKIKIFSRKKIAKEDIVCYKGLLDYEDDELFTPFQEFSIKIGETYHSELKRTKFLSNEVDLGIHSLSNYESAKDAIMYYHIIVKCIIPKGSKYYEGTWTNEKYKSYASNCLKYVEIINN